MIHMGVNIIGALRNMQNKKQFTKSVCFFHEDGREMTVGEARDFLYGELQKGRKVIPVGECDNFNYQTGCMGHKKESE